MRWVFAGLIVIHGLIHFMGFAKAFGLAAMPQLTQPISRVMGAAWLAAGLAMLVTSALFLMASRSWWAVGFAAVLLSQFVIVSAWGDARFGTLANILVLALVVHGFASRGPMSFHASYLRRVRERIAAPTAIARPGERAPVAGANLSLVTEADLASLPQPVQRYLRLAGAVGRPRVHHFRALWRGRIRATANDPWMAFTAEQHNFVREPSRFFLMQATRRGLPVDVFHAFQDGAATMRVRLLSLFPMVDQRGPDFDRAETVTLFNDLCILAPGALLDAAIRWKPIDDRSARAHYTAGRYTISAELFFNAAGELVDFVSDDRLATSPDGKGLTKQRWSTPVREYRSFGPWRVASRGEGQWHAPDGKYAYIELELLDLEINGAR